LLICGDTIVCHDGKIIEKPVFMLLLQIDKKDCVEMMGSLANKTHQAYTAHTIVFNTEPQIKFEWVAKADVAFGDVPI
jgi:predicted house-cleaning NTP pyrophosphatase (Maf/HAM1 superfamily)